MRPQRFPPAVIAILVGSALALGGQPERVDGDGDSLPNGARFRFATMHLRQPGSIRNSALSPDGKLLATASGRSVMIWDLRSGRSLRQYRAPDTSAYSTPGLTFSPDGTLLGYVHGSESACVWSLRTGKEVLRLDGKATNIDGCGQFTPDGSQFVTADGKGIWYWSLSTGASQVVPAQKVNSFSPDAKLYVRVDEQAVTVLGDAQTGKEIRTLDAATANNGIENGLAFSPDGKWLALVNIDKAVELRDTASGAVRASFALPASAFRKDRGKGYPHYRVGLTRDAKVVFLGMRDGTLHRWNVAAKKELPTLKVHQGDMANIHDTPDGQTLITTGADGLIRTWSLTTGEALAEPKGYAMPRCPRMAALS